MPAIVRGAYSAPHPRPSTSRRIWVTYLDARCGIGSVSSGLRPDPPLWRFGHGFWLCTQFPRRPPGGCCHNYHRYHGRLGGWRVRRGGARVGAQVGGSGRTRGGAAVRAGLPTGRPRAGRRPGSAAASDRLGPGRPGPAAGGSAAGGQRLPTGKTATGKTAAGNGTAGAAEGSASLLAAVPTPEKVGLRALVVAVDAADFGLPTWRATLDRVGAPYDVLLTRTTALTAETLVRPDGAGRYNAILLTSSSLLLRRRRAASSAVWTVSSGTCCGRTSVTSRCARSRSTASHGTWPEDYCLRPVSEGGVGDTPLPARLTTAGANRLRLSARRPHRCRSSSRTSTAPRCRPAARRPRCSPPAPTSPVLGVTSTSTDGRQRLALTFSSEPAPAAGRPADVRAAALGHPGAVLRRAAALPQGRRRRLVQQLRPLLPGRSHRERSRLPGRGP